LDNPYGVSKRQAEEIIEAHYKGTGLPICIYRLPGVFGKWCKPNYNSVVATFCYNVAHDLPLAVHAPGKRVDLVYIDDVVSSLINSLSHDIPPRRASVQPCYEVTLDQLAKSIQSFKENRSTGITAPVGTGLSRALYATYLSYLDAAQFSYPLQKNVDARGEFVEVLKTEDSGQFSYFTAHPGVTRGGHYHHTKSEKFLVIRGTARFGFRHMVTNERFELTTYGGNPEVVETIPGWTHDITNMGAEELVVMLWANEIYDRLRPDTIQCRV
jgi:UDP-2-acetamido-2,6-beta-L-arabino-hexul-4-ose reductase